MQASAPVETASVRRVVVVGQEANAVGRAVRSRRGPGMAVAGFVGHDEQAARQMADEMLGGVDRVEALSDEGGTAKGATAPGPPPDG